MTGVVVLASLAAGGVLGIAYGLGRRQPSLEAIYSVWQQSTELPPVPAQGSAVAKLGGAVLGRLDEPRRRDGTRVRQFLAALAVTGTEPLSFVTTVLVVVSACALGPIVLWLAAQAAGVGLPLGPVVIVSVVATPVGLAVPLMNLYRRATERRRHVRVVVSSYVDLVVLSLAGGVGVDGALFSASQVSTDWVAQRIARGLFAARDAGVAPWSALAAIGEEFDISELVELAATVQLAGTEGARIRQALSARGASLRRHEQADAESAANAVTERLFIPGVLLLLGFLLFIGYPAVCRILGGL